MYDKQVAGNEMGVRRAIERLRRANKGIGVIVQARCGSKRFPNKVIQKIGKDTILELIIKRIRRCKKVDKIIIATTNKEEDNKIEHVAQRIGVKIFRGDENDVLTRFVEANKKIKCKTIVRITGDCPFIDPEIIDSAIVEYENTKVEYLSNTEPATYPDGLDVEIFSAERLSEAQKRAKTREEREHVTPWIKKNEKLKKKNVTNSKDYSQVRLTIDYQVDLKVARNLEKKLKGEENISLKSIIKEYETNKELFEENSQIKRNGGTEKVKGKRLWTKAKKIIPGGAMLFSKRPELYLPEGWPTYYKKAKGCEIEDLDGRMFHDMSVMGMGTNILGYGNKRVDDAVIENLRKGNMCTLNCPEEVELAEKLVEINPWSDMAHFARTGGEANAVAIRIARAATGKNTVAVCGYHGWHDWYLAANLRGERELERHVMPGLLCKGVNKELEGTVLTFGYNRFDELSKIVEENELAAVKMEVERSENPKDNFLKKVRKLCNEKNIVLIFDECTSGFRETYGGLHLKYDVDPDMAIYGKAMGNGYAITATVGKRQIMECANKTFISSTFWTERIGPTAALETIKIMEETQSWKDISKKGEKIKKGWAKIAKENGLNIKISGINALPSYVFESKNHNKYKTFITQEMMKYNFLATTNCYVSTTHTEELIEEYLDKLNRVYKKIGEFENEAKNKIDEWLNSEESKSGFGRLN